MKVPHGAAIVVADGGRFALFRNRGTPFDPDLELIEQEAADFPKTSELGADRPGRAFESVGARRSAYEMTDIRDKVEEDYCRDIARRVEQLVAGTREGVLLVAAPRALGTIRDALSGEARASLTAEVAKDYTGLSAAEVGRLLANLPD
ncbi:MAG: host attachment protein [Sphingomonadaceae bacterium]